MYSFIAKFTGRINSEKYDTIRTGSLPAERDN